MLSRIVMFIFSFKATRVTKSEFLRVAAILEFLKSSFSDSNRFKTKNKHHYSTQHRRLPLP
jgi:hypothetical protein